MDHDPTTFEAWSGPSIDGTAHPTNFWQSEEISNRCFCHVSWHVSHCILFQPIKRQSDLFSWPYGGLTLHVVYLYLLTYWDALHKVKRPQWHLAVFWLARLSQLTADWLLVPGNYYRFVCSLPGVSSPLRDSLLVASLVCILPRDICQPRHKQTQKHFTISYY